MKIEMKFDIKERVGINELEREGVVKEIRFADSGGMYRVRYFDKGEANDVWFYEEELSNAKK